MKKFVIGLLVLFVFAVTVPLATNAQTCYPRKRNVSRSYYNNAYYAQNRNYQRRSYYTQSNYRRPNYFQRHRNVKNIAIGAGAGALLGGLIGGNRKGIGVGALIGAGGGALYTYVLKPKKQRYRYYR